MPCFLTQQIHVDLTKVDPAFVDEALKGLEGIKHFLPGANYTVVNMQNGDTLTYSQGKLTITTRNRARTSEIENEVKRGISKAVLQAANKKFRWQLKQTKENEYDVEKRGF